MHTPIAMRSVQRLRPTIHQSVWRRRCQSSKSSEPLDPEALLANPTWSVQSLINATTSSTPTPAVTKDQLHHLLRLSALPLPTSEIEEAKMIGDLQAQLKFVQAIQSVNTTNVEPLQGIRDETEEARRKRTITIETLKDDLGKAESVDRRGRIRRKKVSDAAERESQAQAESRWNPLSHASKTHGPYFVVDTATD